MSKAAPCLCACGMLFLISCTDEPLRTQKMFGKMSMQNWAEQDRATNVQDWHRMAQKIADAMQARGLLAGAPVMSPSEVHSVPVPQRFYVGSEQNTPFVRELGQALKTEILQRGGSLAASSSRAQVVDLGVNVVSWGSRAKSEPERVRTEAVWIASITSQDRVLMTLQEPFYIFDADIPQYVQINNPGQQLARIARPLLYVR